MQVEPAQCTYLTLSSAAPYSFAVELEEPLAPYQLRIISSLPKRP